MKKISQIILLLTLICGIALGQIAPIEPAPVLEPILPEPVTIPSAPTLPKTPSVILALELKVSTSEPEIRDGRLLEVQKVSAVDLPIASVLVSRAKGTISSGIEAALQKLAQELNTPSDARFYRLGKIWVAQQHSAWKLDILKTRAALLEAIKNRALTAEAVLSRKPPKRSVNELYKRGIRHFFGGGGSSFAGSPSYRVQNIVAAAKQLDARYLERGAAFNFNSSIRLSAKAGFVLGNIIRGSTLSKEIGGGICQVSTTVWRAAYEAGLPILERHQHSYRVAYYDPPGYEATVFAPSKNLRFGNDSRSALWMQLDWDTNSGRLEMNFFGGRPERQVQIGQPRISSERPAPKDRFIADKEVKLGDVQIVSGAEAGMNAQIDRTVRYNSGKIRRDSTKSRYVPWGAIYAVNPKDPRARK